MRDGGIRGVVVHPSGGEFDKIDIHGNEITAGVGAKLKEIAYAARGADLGGLEWMEGIPGAVGGALRMNAGAMGSQTFENVVQGSLSRSPTGTRTTRNATNLKFITGIFLCSKITSPSPPYFAERPIIAEKIEARAA